MIQPIVNPRSRPKKMDEVLEMKLALVSELRKKSDGERGQY